MKIDVDKLVECIKKLADANILVVGDLALDEMIYGDTERISREAPVLILRHTHTNLILGAASNAANNVSSINNGKVSVLGVVGEDYQANDLRNSFDKAGIDCSNLIVDKVRKTTTKTRISGSCFQSITQQIVRIDRQSSEPLSEEIQNKLLEKLSEIVPRYDGVILSDYHIGTLTDKVIERAIDICNTHNKKVIVDAQRNLDKYKHITSMTPNLPDTQKHVGFTIKSDEDLYKAAYKLQEETFAESILVTCGAEGMALFTNDKKMKKIPVFNKSKVFDVTGAGDTVTAVYGLAITVGVDPLYAAIIGNMAAGIVVKQFGCATTTIEELLSFIEQHRNLLKDFEIGECNE